jgi:bifunctional DNase/RNase
VQGLTGNRVQSGTYALILAEEDGLRRIPVVVGVYEAQSIAIALEGLMPPRPLTHDLLCVIAEKFDLGLVEAFIYKFDDGVFFSELVFKRGNDLIRIDSRTSDAIAIAIRAKCDIYAHPDVLDECGLDLEDLTIYDDGDDDDEEMAFDPDDIKSEAALKIWLAAQNSDDLQDRLADAISIENYEHAKIYMDEIRRREAKRERERDD